MLLRFLTCLFLFQHAQSQQQQQQATVTQFHRAGVSAQFFQTASDRLGQQPQQPQQPQQQQQQQFQHQQLQPQYQQYKYSNNPQFNTSAPISPQQQTVIVSELNNNNNNIRQQQQQDIKSTARAKKSYLNSEKFPLLTGEDFSSSQESIISNNQKSGIKINQPKTEKNNVYVTTTPQSEINTTEHKPHLHNNNHNHHLSDSSLLSDKTRAVYLWVTAPLLLPMSLWVTIFS